MRAIKTAIAGALLAGLTFGSAPAAVASSATIRPTQPVQDACYDYRAGGTKAQAATAPAVPCEGPHTAQTFYVRSLPESFGVPKDASAKKRLRVAKACTPDAMNAYLGLTNTAIPSRFQIVTVFPTDAQWNAGERWMRCDVVLQGRQELHPILRDRPRTGRCHSSRSIRFLHTQRSRIAHQGGLPMQQAEEELDHGCRT